MKKKISQLKKSEYFEGAKLALKNAEDHLLVSQKAVDEKIYGIAT